MKEKLLIVMLASCALITMSACANPDDAAEILSTESEEEQSFQSDITIHYSDDEQQSAEQEEQENSELQTEQQTEQQSEQEEEQQLLQDPQEDVTAAVYIKYIKVTSDGVNIRSGAGTGYAVSGTAETDTYYACIGETDGWYKIYYLNKTAWISKKYSQVYEMLASEDAAIESVIEEGTKLLGTPYVYGAVRYHDGSGNLNKNFTVGEFDCSSLTQYIFIKGADVLLNVTTRTQILQGTTVSKSDLQRGDLLFFTNSSRCNNTGIERVGHVALYLGNNLILHTSSDYAKIESISAQRWSYFLQAQRML